MSEAPILLNGALFGLNVVFAATRFARLWPLNAFCAAFQFYLAVAP